MSRSYFLRINKSLGWTLILVSGLTFSAFGTTPSPPRIRYSIDNQTKQSISTIRQLESADSLFSTADTTEVVDDLAGDFVGYAHERSQFKPYIKLLIQTNERQYSTPVLVYKDRCAAYEIRLTQTGVSVEESDFYRIRCQVVRGLIVILIVFVLKWVPFALIVRQPVRMVYTLFWIVNGALAVSLLFFPYKLLSTFTHVAYLLAASFIIESITYYRFGPSAQQRNQLIAASLVGNLLCLPGQLVVLIAQFLFAGC